MRKGADTILLFHLPSEAIDLTDIDIYFSQNSESLIIKHLADCTIKDCDVYTELSYIDTNLLKSTRPLEVQLRCVIKGKRLVSQVFNISVDRLIGGVENA